MMTFRSVPPFQAVIFEAIVFRDLFIVGFVTDRVCCLFWGRKMPFYFFYSALRAFIPSTGRSNKISNF